MKKKIPRVVVEGRVIAGKDHCDKFERRMEDVEKKEKEKLKSKEDREREKREKKQLLEKKLQKRNPKKTVKIATKSDKSNEPTEESSKNDAFSSTSCTRTVSKRKSKENVYKSIKQMIDALQYDSSRSTNSRSEEEFSISDNDSDDSENSSPNMDAICFNCKSKYPPTKRKIKKTDLVQCDLCDYSFHEFCVTRDELRDDFKCNIYC